MKVQVKSCLKICLGAIMLTALALSKADPAMPRLDTFEEVKRFPYVTYGKAWEGTPASSDEVILPATVIAYGDGESEAVVASASQIAYYIGQWTEDMGIGPEDKPLPSIVMPLKRALKTDKAVILLGVHNEVVKDMKLKFERPTLKVVTWKGKKILVVGGKDDRQVVKAANFLAHRVIGFKAGAYKTFFSFVKLRGLIENENFAAAEYLIKDPSGLSACGKNLSLAAPTMKKFPPKVKEVVKERNRIMYVDLVKALEDKDKEKAVALWRKAMFTCYQCHQGIGIPRLRNFNPPQKIHSRHQKIAEKFGLVKRGQVNCTACHIGKTHIRGY